MSDDRKYIIDPGPMQDCVVHDSLPRDCRGTLYRVVATRRGKKIERFAPDLEGWYDIKDTPNQTPIKVLKASGLYK